MKEKTSKSINAAFNNSYQQALEKISTEQFASSRPAYTAPKVLEEFVEEGELHYRLENGNTQPAQSYNSFWKSKLHFKQKWLTGNGVRLATVVSLFFCGTALGQTASEQDSTKKEWTARLVSREAHPIKYSGVYRIKSILKSGVKFEGCRGTYELQSNDSIFVGKEIIIVIR